MGKHDKLGSAPFFTASKVAVAFLGIIVIILVSMAAAYQLRTRKIRNEIASMRAEKTDALAFMRIEFGKFVLDRTKKYGEDIDAVEKLIDASTTKEEQERHLAKKYELTYEMHDEFVEWVDKIRALENELK